MIQVRTGLTEAVHRALVEGASDWPDLWSIPLDRLEDLIATVILNDPGIQVVPRSAGR